MLQIPEDNVIRGDIEAIPTPLVIIDLIELKALSRLLNLTKRMSFDYETTGLDFVSDMALGLSLCTDTGINTYIVIRHGEKDYLAEEDVAQELKPHFERDGVILIAHNLKFDIQWLWNMGIDIGWKCDKGQAACTQLMSVLVDENRENHKLKPLAHDIFHVQTITFEDLVESGKYESVPLEKAADYGRHDALYCFKLYDYFLPLLDKYKLLDVFWKLEMRYLKVLALMERRGVYIDMELLNEYEARITKEMNTFYTTLKELAGEDINFNSGDQLGNLLFKKWGAPIQAYTEGGKKPKKDGTFAPPKPKTDADTMETLAKMEGEPWTDFCRALLRFKELAKIDSTYIKGLRQLIRADGKVHCNFNQTVVVTGRLSSSKPNLQNQPAGPTWVDVIKAGESYPIQDLYPLAKTDGMVTIPAEHEKVKLMFRRHVVMIEVKTKEGKVKDKVKAEEGDTPTGTFRVIRKIRDLYYNPYGVLVVSDYSQMEMRMMAHYSGDHGLLEAFEKKVDIHTWVASKAFGVPMEEVTKEMRSKAKAVGFGVIYGKTVVGFAEDWYKHNKDFWVKGKDGRKFVNKKYLDEAQKFLDDFFAAFGGVKEYMDKVEAYCKKYGYIRTIDGRKRRLPGIFSFNKGEQNRAKRQAVNTKIQGSAAAFIKLAQIKLEETLEALGEGVTQNIQVHDELVLYAPRELAEKYEAVVKHTMENVIPLKVTIITEPCIAERWGAAK